MSDLAPRGIPVQFGMEERRFLFDYAVIAEIQEAYDSDVLSAIGQMWLDKHSPGEYRAKVLIDIVHKLLLDETDREKVLYGRELKTYTKKQVGWMIDQGNADNFVEAILKAWTYSIPEPDGDEDPNATRGTKATETEGSISPEQS